MMKRIAQVSVFLTILLSSFLCAAQDVYSNALTVGAGYYYFPGKLYYNQYLDEFLIPIAGPLFSSVLSASYERRVSKHWKMGINYASWNILFYPTTQNYYPPGVANQQVFDQPNLLDRHSYRMADVYAAHVFHYKKKHSVSFGIGISYAWGINSLFAGVDSTFHLISFDHNVQYLGFVPSVAYNYSILRKRVAIGFDIKGRKYINLDSAEFDYGLHIAYKFND